MMIRLLRLLLWLCPPTFRRTYGHDVIEFYRAQRTRLVSARATHWLRVRLGSRTAFDLARTAVAEWADRLAGDCPGSPVFRQPESTMTDRWLLDVRTAARHLFKSPAFTITAILTLGLGTGGTIAVFTLVDALVLRSQPFVRAHELVRIYQDSDDGAPESNAYPAYVDMRARDDLFAGVAAVMPEASATLIGPSGEVSEVGVQFATASYLPVLGLTPARGRWFISEEDLATAPPAAVVTYAAWQRRFGSDPDLVGRAVRLSGATVTIVGVGPRGHDSIAPGLASDFWLSISALGPVGGRQRGATLQRRQDHWFQVVARLQPATGLEQARTGMQALASRLDREYPDTDRGRRITVLPVNAVRMHPLIDGRLYAAAAAPMVLAILVLLVVCSNLANLMLARGAARRREFAVRLALGATRARIVRGLTIESLLLAAAGGAVGLLAAGRVIDLLNGAALPLPLPAALSAELGGRVVLFAAGLSVATGLAFGVAPALRATRRDLLPALKQGSAQPEHPWLAGARSFRAALVIVQVAVSVVLIVAVGLLVRTLAHASRLDLGFDPESTAVVSVDPSQAGRRGSDAQRALLALRERMLTRPGVRSVALSSRIPLTPVGASTTIVLDGDAGAEGEDRTTEVKVASVTPDYFATLRLPVLRGRAFASTDDATSPAVAVVSAAMAERYWGTIDVVGRRYRPQSAPDGWIDIVGVAGDVPIESPGEAPRPFAYRPALQAGLTRATFVVRTDGPPADVVSGLREEVRALDPLIPVLQADTMQAHVGRSLRVQRLITNLLAGFGAFAIGLAVLGIYSITAAGVSARRNEIGVRLAIGASRAQVIRLVAGDMLTVVGAGAAVGLGLAAVATPVLARLLVGVAPRDPATFAAVTVLVLLCALAATWMPARRAARTTISSILRAD